jgi:hypothetical protein
LGAGHRGRSAARGWLPWWLPAPDRQPHKGRGGEPWGRGPPATAGTQGETAGSEEEFEPVGKTQHRAIEGKESRLKRLACVRRTSDSLDWPARFSSYFLKGRHTPYFLNHLFILLYDSDNIGNAGRQGLQCPAAAVTKIGSKFAGPTSHARQPDRCGYVRITSGTSLTVRCSNVLSPLIRQRTPFGSVNSTPTLGISHCRAATSSPLKGPSPVTLHIRS